MSNHGLRHSIQEATGALAALLPNVAQRTAAAQVMATSIRRAHQQAPSSWELTAWQNRLRLNVGQVAVLDLKATHLRVYTAVGPGLENYGYYLSTYGHYTAVDIPCEAWEVSLAAELALAAPLLERHYVLIQEAANAKSVSPFKRYHSPAFVVALATLTGSTVPQPGYYNGGIVEYSDAVPNGAGQADGAVFGTSEENREVEVAAVRHVTAFLRNEGWEVYSVEGNQCGYDLHCERSGEERHVEVKGTRGGSDRFIITAGEVGRANTDPEFELVLVSHALTLTPTVEWWKGSDLLTTFTLRPIQYVAQRSAI